MLKLKLTCFNGIMFFKFQRLKHGKNYLVKSTFLVSRTVNNATKQAIAMTAR